MKSTEQTILEIDEKLTSNLNCDPKADYVVLKPISDYSNVDFSVIAKHYNTEEIHSYAMTDKIVITIPSK